MIFEGDRREHAEVAQQLTRMQADPIIVGPFLWNNWHVTFAMSFLARLLGLISLRNMPDAGSRPFSQMARTITGNVYSQAVAIVVFPLRVFVRRRGDQGHNGPTGK